MANQLQHFLTAIDVGSAKTCVLVAEVTDSGLRYRGHGVAESRGSRKGVIVDLEKAVASIQKAVERAEDACGAPIEHALLGVSGAHVRGVNSQGGLSFGTRAREIAREEIRSAVDKARAIPLPADREILHLLPQEFILDEQSVVHDPLGMMAMRLEVRVHMVTAGSSATQTWMSSSPVDVPFGATGRSPSKRLPRTITQPPQRTVFAASAAGSSSGGESTATSKPSRLV